MQGKGVIDNPDQISGSETVTVPTNRGRGKKSQDYVEFNAVQGSIRISAPEAVVQAQPLFDRQFRRRGI